MLDAKKLLGFEYFPGELPECFTSQGLAQHYLELKGQINSNSFPSSIPWEFTIYKGENSRRRMALPNPIHYFKIVELLVQNEKDLFDIFEKSDYSLTKPSTNQNDTQKRAYNRVSNNPMQTRQINEKNFCDNTICIKLDILLHQLILEDFCLSKRRNTASEILDRRQPVLRFLPCLATFIRRINNSRLNWWSSK